MTLFLREGDDVAQSRMTLKERSYALVENKINRSVRKCLTQCAEKTRGQDSVAHLTESDDKNSLLSSIYIITHYLI